MTNRREHDLSCPLCARGYTLSSEAAEPPLALPCSPCWRSMGAVEKAPWVRRMRALPANRRGLVHRDPVPYAPDTLRAYVENLEVALAAKEALLRDRGRRIAELEALLAEARGAHAA